MKFLPKIFSLALLILTTNACQQNKTAPNDIQTDTLFKLHTAAETHIDFINKLDYNDSINCYTYRSFYNGGGVGVGDVNNDGLPDIFFCGNRQPSRLYINKGNFVFEDVTEKAGLLRMGVWATGVSFADVNGDGFLDIYVCKSGPPTGEKRYNELFINNGDGTFTEAAKKWGIADIGLSTHAAFFDYDHDGDLDCYVLNNSLKSVVNFDAKKGLRDVRDLEGGNKLYRNDGDHFTDVSAQAGIYGSAITFGLGVTIGDINRDGWDDIYVSNDFFERDYLYINQHNGTFKEDLENQMTEISMGSMGADMQDINNDGFPEVMVTEMCPHTNARLKTKVQFDSWNRYQLMQKEGYGHQFGRNVLQLNNGNGTFSEIGRMLGVEATEWSWSALMADFDNDGNKDIFVANGIGKDLLDQDYVNFIGDRNKVGEIIRGGKGMKGLIDTIPSERVPNFAFKNNGNGTFTDITKAWGLNMPSFSNGSVYVDLDNDGDLDLVVNNVDAPPFIYENTISHQPLALSHEPSSDNKVQSSKLTANSYLRVVCDAGSKNKFGIGTQVTLFTNGKTLYQEVAPMRGFQSCVESRLLFGVGEAKIIDSVYADFANGKRLTLRNVPTNQTINVKQNDATEKTTPWKLPASKKIFTEIAQSKDLAHTENEFSDFDVERLLFNMTSNEGPKIATGDVNGDGIPDLYLPASRGFAGQLFLGDASGHLKKTIQPDFDKDARYKDSNAIFFDADNDGDLDLCVASGSYDGTAFDDRLYLNDGKGHFKRSPTAFPAKNNLATACIRAMDINGDGFQDLIIAMRLIPGSYGTPVSTYFFINDGKGGFDNKTDDYCKDLKNIGMVTDVQTVDIDGDGDLDIVLCGEWMPITILINDGKKFRKTEIPNSSGWWNVCRIADINGDGKPDLVCGNLGLNARFHADVAHPLDLYVGDFDGNGSTEPIICQYEGDKSFPCALRPDMVSQLPTLKKKYLHFADYKGQTAEDIFGKEKLAKTIHAQVQTLASTVFYNLGNAQFDAQHLPLEAQRAPIYAIALDDFDNDGKIDIVTAGNQSRAKPETGIYEADYGTFLHNAGNKQFTARKPSPLNLHGDIRSAEIIKQKNKKMLIFGVNNGAARVFGY